ncbi:putative hydroxylase [[Actinomadura] parvosata subsp. kistnae]|uniref:Hydroxylase n=1 Tax=[Actinomadura] parvosata subsp. kistnae TaxID=1909395 RepID=A0A1V0A4Y4_9ACTN|nr:NAD(P)H-binding protein [Nonomuraea sp. ATCC 55076]AQZ65261.1 hydroxylase [Nonomuraea sp. ATCC 55076]SPL96568.1 putative hydroxylase [Actinomadura parvosata subsp. kistnae]
MVMVVFGAGGNVGRHVAAALRSAGHPLRLTSRNPATLRPLDVTATFSAAALSEAAISEAAFSAAGGAAEVEVVAADLDRPDTLPAALAGATHAFIYARPDGIDGFVRAATDAGVRRVVLLSSAAVVLPGSARNPIARQHRAVESALEESGLSWTFIRPGMFATNTLWWWSRPIRNGAAVRLPYPEAMTAPVSERDMAALAVTALIEPGHGRQAYTVYGPQALTLREQVEHIGAALGRRIPVEEVTPEQARAELSEVMPAMGVEAIMGAWAAGTTTAPETSTIVEKLTGRPAQTFAAWARDHAADFRA